MLRSTEDVENGEQREAINFANVRIVELDPDGIGDPFDQTEIFAARAGKISSIVVQLKRDLIKYKDQESVQNRYRVFLSLLDLYKEMYLFEKTFGLKSLVNLQIFISKNFS